uniref:Uncharacterized protein n=1 Tax=Oryza nivara TaxID=4536 RepID=A0A0E0GIR5_ORYNI
MGTTAVAVALIPPRPTRGPRHSQPCPRDPATKQWLEVAGELACHSSVMRLKLLAQLVVHSYWLKREWQWTEIAGRSPARV